MSSTRRCSLDPARELFGEVAARGRRPRLRLHLTASRGLEVGFEALAHRVWMEER